MMSIEQELENLRTRVDRLEAKIQRISETPPHYVVQNTLSAKSGKLSDTAEFLNWMKAEGMIAELPPEAKKLAKKWEVLPEGEKQAHIRFMNHLVLDPPLSEIMIADRR